jgi:hypothetical protein
VADGGEGLLETGSLVVASGHAVIEVDAILADAQDEQGVALRREVLLIGRAAGVTDQDTGVDRMLSHELSSGASPNQHLISADHTRSTSGAGEDQRPAATVRQAGSSEHPRLTAVRPGRPSHDRSLSGDE